MFYQKSDTLSIQQFSDMLRECLNSTNCRKDTVDEFKDYIEVQYNEGSSVYMVLDSLIYFNQTLEW